MYGSPGAGYTTTPDSIDVNPSQAIPKGCTDHPRAGTLTNIEFVKAVWLDDPNGLFEFSVQWDSAAGLVPDSGVVRSIDGGKDDKTSALACFRARFLLLLRIGRAQKHSRI
jgi:hypothetical protein